MNDPLTPEEARTQAECERVSEQYYPASRSVTPTPTQGGPNREWIARSRYDASVCAKCGAAIAPGEFVKIVRRMNFGGPRGSYGDRLPQRGRAAICGACAGNPECRTSGSMSMLVCGACKRLLIGSRGSHQSPACSDRCLSRLAHLRSPGNKKRTERRAEARRTLCTVCGHRFTPARSDAKTCSPACRQKAYRQRCREGVTAAEGGATWHTPPQP